MTKGKKKKARKAKRHVLVPEPAAHVAQPQPAAAPAPARLGIMGGTFDPVHAGHLACARAAAQQLQLDQVLFIPANIPVFKLDQPITPAKHRVALLKRALKDQPGFALDTCEIDRGGKTYTAETLRQLRERYPRTTQFVLITGADAALTLPQWKDAADIAYLAEIAAVARPGSPVDQSSEDYQALMAQFSVHWVDVETPDISSSQVRSMAAAGQRLDGVVPAQALRYLVKKGLYGATAACFPPEGEGGEGQPASDQPALSPHDPAADPLSLAFYKHIKAQMKSRVDERRFRHIQGVAKTAKRIAKVYGVDPAKARLAGMLHDWDKNFDDQGIRARADQVGLDVEPLVRESMPQTLHGMTAAKALPRDYPCIPADVLQAVSHHTTACTNMSDLDMVVFVADCLEPSRHFERCDELRAMVGNVELEELFFQVLGYWITLIIGRGRTMHPSTVETWNHYALRRSTRRRREREEQGLPPVQINPCAVSE
ncbi:MAG: nicotinate-nucleotide adenylyltransferase [Coriobacteriia bacterium]|nr:nicotinate-nucleotide adenylyltransferase [Coriobacteriia bacterium]